MQLLLDHEGYLPVFAHVTEGRIHEVNIPKNLTFPKGSTVVIDRGYVEYALFAKWTEEEIYFVTRQKENADYKVISNSAT